MTSHRALICSNCHFKSAYRGFNRVRGRQHVNSARDCMRGVPVPLQRCKGSRYLLQVRGDADAGRYW